ncbi:MAG: YraN family protein [Cellvibrio sp.]|uniref:YraN family protein n=1 Tax=Cellvibrio sp. TaxID=1965322 RepID=UPI0031A412DB
MVFQPDKDVVATATTTTPPTINTITIGANAEAQAEAFLHGQGLVTRTKNYRCKLGEIDLIMLQKTALGTTFVFVEVRLRTNKRFAPAVETVDYRKQQKIIRTATRFLQEHKLFDKVACRFDVVALDQTDTAPPIQWIQNAFGA